MAPIVANRIAAAGVWVGVLVAAAFLFIGLVTAIDWAVGW